MNGYTEITINGRKAGLKFNMYAIEQMNNIKGRNSSVGLSASTVWVGLLGNAYVKQTEPAFTFEEVNDWVEEKLLSGDPDGELSRIAEVFANSYVMKTLNEKKEKNGEPGEDQKKMIAETL